MKSRPVSNYPRILLLTLDYVPGSWFLYQDLVVFFAGDPEINPR